MRPEDYDELADLFGRAICEALSLPRCCALPYDEVQRRGIPTPFGPPSAIYILVEHASQERLFWKTMRQGYRADDARLIGRIVESIKARLEQPAPGDFESLD